MSGHPAEQLKEFQGQLGLCLSELEMCKEVIREGDVGRPAQMEYCKQRLAYLETHVVPKLRKEVKSAQEYIDWEKRTSGAQPRST